MLDVQAISKSFGSIQALSEVSLRVRSGEIVAVVGENGAGKSTLVKCIARSVIPDTGSVSVGGASLGRGPRDAIESGVSVVWQDLALCENLDVTSNLFLGREVGRGLRLRTASMHARASAMFRDLRVEVPDLDRPIQRLSGGQRQLVAIARATLDDPRVLVLDEPTAALGVAETTTVLEVVETLRDRGVAIVLISHQLDDVFEVADRIVVLRHGTVVADVHRSEAHPDDIVGFITGADVDSSAGRQLRRLHSLAEQLSDADEGSILPLTVSSLSGALHADRLAIFIADRDQDAGTVLRCAASVNLPEGLTVGLGPIDAERRTSFLGEAAVERSMVVVADLRQSAHDPVAEAAVAQGMVGAWAAPIVGQRDVIAVVVGFTDTVAQLHTDQIQLLGLFSTMAGAAIERGRLVETLRERNRYLVGLQGVLETLAGPGPLQGGLSPALRALCRGVECDAAGLLLWSGSSWEARDVARLVDQAPSRSDVGRDEEMMVDALTAGGADDVYAASFDWSRGRAAVACLWRDRVVPVDAADVVEGAGNSFRLALERELTVEAEQSAATLHRTRTQERLLTRRLGHELRTPLTAIRGFASTLLQPDVEWTDEDQHRFLAIIERESGRMGRLVEQLFDESAIRAGTLRLAFHYCDLVKVLQSAIDIGSSGRQVDVDLPESFTVWGDRDRLQQVFVNLIANAFRHNDHTVAVSVRLEHEPSSPTVTVRVVDDGVGIPPDAITRLADHPDDPADTHGLGLRLVDGFVRAHGGSVRIEHDERTVVAVELPIDEDAACR